MEKTRLTHNKPWHARYQNRDKRVCRHLKISRPKRELTGRKIPRSNAPPDLSRYSQIDKIISYLFSNFPLNCSLVIAIFQKNSGKYSELAGFSSTSIPETNLFALLISTVLLWLVVDVHHPLIVVKITLNRIVCDRLSSKIGYPRFTKVRLLLTWQRLKHCRWQIWPMPMGR